MSTKSFDLMEMNTVIILAMLQGNEFNYLILVIYDIGLSKNL